MGATGYRSTTAMERTRHRLQKQQKGLAATRTMGILAGAGSPAAYLAVDGAAGFAVAAFLAFAALFLILNSAAK